jgi:hypothetical protein
VDSGVLNPDLNVGGSEAKAAWKNARLRDRIDAVAAHEDAEVAAGGSHEDALQNAPNTALPVRDNAREILRAMAAARGY